MNENIIRKLIVGTDPLKAFVFMVGGKAGVAEITYIEFDERAFTKYSVYRYHIYIQRHNETILWKTVENMPVIVEYDCDFN